MGVRVIVRDGEPLSHALRRLRRSVESNGLTAAMRRHLYYVSGVEIRRAKRFHRRFVAREATWLAQQAGEQPVASLAAAHAELWRRTGKP